MASGAAFLAAAVLFLPELGLLVAAAALGDANPPLDAARLG
jgi:hypothetical protein